METKDLTKLMLEIKQNADKNPSVTTSEMMALIQKRMSNTLKIDQKEIIK
ncbi:hypothetical protein [Evansella cellulosilytica]|uniref:Uncharacterized protein n=1 Tax=Evansella cellulosilytica (strain ATCC 21833 / DSM 2522 / FERM P-1141 / JCM 9156 / N-4) TaxID=649639 RepID=E6TU23_EVAC2|nr:hypothetical protein [Evansella cellulosilytica]ADU32054.1 hypothetical protein Bcell_3815 [Evansella cellulosilytica DSM 2522]